MGGEWGINDGFLGWHNNDASAQAYANALGWLKVGAWYHNTTTNTRLMYDGVTWISTGVGVSLDDAYNFGSIITADAGAVRINNAVADASNALELNRTNPVGGYALNVIAGDVRMADNVVIGGNLEVMGSTISHHSENVLIGDNHLYLNAGYTVNVAQTGGLVVNYFPTPTTDTVAGSFVAGVGGVSNPTVQTVGANMYFNGDLIQISGCNNVANDGLYEVVSHVGTLLTVKGIGTIPTVEDFTSDQFTTDATPGGSIVQVNVSIMRAGTDGLWEVAQGNNTGAGLVFTDLALAGAFNTLDQAYDQGGPGAGRVITADNGPVTIRGVANPIVPPTLLYIDQSTNPIQSSNGALSRWDIDLAYAGFGNNCVGMWWDVVETASSPPFCFYTGWKNDFTVASGGALQDLFMQDVLVGGGAVGGSQDLILWKGRVTMTSNHGQSKITGIDYNHSGALTNFQYAYGIHITMPDDATPQNNPLYGVFVEMPNPYNGTGMMAGRFEGDGNLIELCKQSIGLELSGNEPIITMGEINSIAGPLAGKAIWWVRDDTPNVPMFTDDAGTDWNLLIPSNIGVKTVFVDPGGTPGTDCDFTTIALACAYLNSLPNGRGGRIALKGGVNHPVSTVVDARGIEFTQAGEGRATIQAQTGGSLQCNGGNYIGVRIEVPAGFAGTSFMDINESGSTTFTGCDFKPTSGKFIFGTTGTPSTTLTFFECGQSDQNGAMVDTASTFSLYFFTTIGENTLGSLQFGAWDIYTDAGGRADTTGTVNGLPDDILYVFPGENLQARLDSLDGVNPGGAVWLLPGIHDVETHQHITYDSITLQGFGSCSILRAQSATWLAGACVTVDDWTALAGATLSITTSVGGPVVLTEGVQWTAGVDNPTTAQSLASAIVASSGTHGLTASQIGTGGSVHIVAVAPGTTITTMTSSDTANLPASPPALGDGLLQVGAMSGAEPVNGCTVRDIQLQVEPNIHGIKVNGGSGNVVQHNEVNSTALKTSGRVAILLTDSQGTNAGAPGTGLTASYNKITSTGPATRWVDGIHMDGDSPFVGLYGYGNRIQDSIMSNNIVEYAHETGYVCCACDAVALFTNRARTVCYTATAIGFALLDVIDSEIVTTSIQDNQTVNADGAYLYGCNGMNMNDCDINGIGNAFNPGIQLLLNTDDCIITDNKLRNCTVGIDINAGCDNNIVTPNKFLTGVTTPIVDGATVTFYKGTNRTGTVNPNGVVTGFFGDCYYDTVLGDLYKCVSKPQGTVWQVI